MRRWCLSASISPIRFDLQNTSVSGMFRDFGSLAIPTQITLNWNPRLRSLRSIWVVMLSKPTWLLGITGPCWGGIAVAMTSWEGSKPESALSEEQTNKQTNNASWGCQVLGLFSLLINWWNG